MPLERSIAEVLQAHGDTLKDEIKVSLPATVTAVNGRFVDVKIAVQNPLLDEFGNLSFEDMGGFSNVPLAVLRGGGTPGFFVWVPVVVGDSVLLVFSDLSLDTWRAATPGGQPPSPGWVGKHTADSPVAYPMIAPDALTLSANDTPSDTIVIGQVGGSAQIRINGMNVQLGATAGDFVALASLVATELGKIATALASATWPGGMSPAPVVYASPYTTPGNVASSLVKSQ